MNSNKRYEELMLQKAKEAEKVKSEEMKKNDKIKQLEDKVNVLSRRLSSYNQSKLNSSDLDMGSKSVDIKSASKAPSQEVKTSSGFFAHNRPFGEGKMCI